MIKQFLSFLLILGLGLLLLTPPQPAAAQYLGEVTWTATITETETGPLTVPLTITIKAGITRVGGNYYSVQGQSLTSNPYILSGGGVLLGDILYVSCATSQRSNSTSWQNSGILHAEVNRITLNGSFYEIGRDFDPTYRLFKDHYAAGTLTRTGGLSTLTSSLPGPGLLLLDKN